MLQETMQAKTTYTPSKKFYLFDIFMGTTSASGPVKKTLSVGMATHVDGQHTYRLYLKTFISSEFFLMKENVQGNMDYAILTREEKHGSGKKYFYHRVGYAKILSGSNSGFLSLNWYLFPSVDLYMNLHPKDIRDVLDSTLEE
jgi:hypothetical protein